MAVSPLGAARLRRRLTLEEAAARAQMEVDQVKSLEENCMYRFGSNADALAAALVYATALGISEREARQIAGLPTGSRLVDPFSIRRTLAVVAFLAGGYARRVEDTVAIHVAMVEEAARALVRFPAV